MTTEYNPFSLCGKTILVTGASSGIGRSIAIACAKMGGTIVLNGRNSEELKNTYNDMPKGMHIICAGDLTDAISVEKMLNEIPMLDGIVHCAGVGHRKVCKLITEKDISEVMDVNFKSAVLLQSKLLFRKKIKKSSSIVFIASRAAASPSIGNAVYSASKGALISYAKCLMLELAPRQIRVNCICPAMVWTDLILKGGITKDELILEQGKYPLKRFGKPEDIAYLAIYMLSDASSWMTGSCVDLTGGGE